MDTISRYIDRNSAIIQLVGGIIATLITVTVYAYSTFVTKAEMHDAADGIKKFEDYRLDRLETKLDKIDDMLSDLKGRKYEK